MMAVKVLVTHRLSEVDLARLRAVGPGVEVECADTMEEALAQAPEAEVIQAGRWSEELRRAAPRLRWVHSGGAGVERYLTPEFIAGPVVLTNSRGVYAVPIADHVMAFALHFSRHFGRFARDQAARRWADWGEGEPDELQGKTLGIIGLGAIGAEVARRARAFGMRVIATRRRPKLSCEYADEVRGPDGLAWLLGESDFAAICAALTPETRHLIGAEQLGAMKQGAYLVNIARGGLVDEAALVEALRAGSLAGAGLDVFEEEPLPPESPLWELPNVMITPHNAGSSPRSHERFLALFLDNLGRYLRGEPLLNVVDKQAGY